VKTFEFYTISNIKTVLSKNNLNLQKKFAQNFLVNEKIVDRIIDKLEIDKNDLVIEIGCGLGGLTNRLIDLAKMVIGFEIDYGYVNLLNKIFGSATNFKLISGDFLKKSKEIFNAIDKKEFNKIILVGNLPYNITKEIFEISFTSNLEFDKWCFMIQKEMLDKINAKIDSKKYCYLSIISQIGKDVEVISHISKNDFYPSPNVDSISLLFTKNSKHKIIEKELFFRLAKSLFLNRRKKLVNNLMLSTLLYENEKNILENAIKEINLDISKRGETLKLEDIINLSNKVSLLIS